MTPADPGDARGDDRRRRDRPDRCPGRGPRRGRPPAPVRPDRSGLRLPAAGAVDLRHRAGRRHLALHVGREPVGDPSARLDRDRGRRTGLRAARLSGLRRAGAAAHPPCRRDRPDGHRRPPDPSHRRPHRDPLPRLRIAGLPRGLPRSEGAGDRDPRGARRSPRPQPPVAGLGLRRHRRLHVASARARRLGGVRGRRALRPLRPRRGRGARHGPAPGRRRGPEGDDRGPRRAPHRAAPAEPRPARDRQRRAARRLGPRRGIVRARSRPSSPR